MLVIILIPGEEAARRRNNLADIQPTRGGIVLQQQHRQLIIYCIVLDSNYLIKPLPCDTLLLRILLAMYYLPVIQFTLEYKNTELQQYRAP